MITSDKNRERALKYYHEHKDEINQKKKEKRGSWSPTYKMGIKLADQKKRRKLKQAVFNLLGNKCAVCGFDDVRALQIDHKEGGGNKERTGAFPNRNQPKYWRHILEVRGEGYQLLCANHNWIKRFEKGEHNQYTKNKYNVQHSDEIGLGS